ncbi:MAG: chemotaxis protein CheW [Thermoleophilia bacterium]|nr:chemotaxis protein CheW [Thermoleophilia bacterium]
MSMQSNGSSVLYEPGMSTTDGGPTANGGGPTGSTETWVLFSVDSQKYGLLIAEVERILRAVEVKPLPQSPPHVLGIINMQGAILPVIDLRYCLGRPERPIQPEDHFIVARTPTTIAVLPVDAALGSVEVPVGSDAAGEKARDRYLRKIVPWGHEVIYALDLERVVFGDESPEDSQLTSALQVMEKE